MQRGILAPVFIEDVQLPFEFRRIQAARLVDWNGEADDIEFIGLREALKRIIGRGESLVQEPPTIEKERSQAKVGTQAEEKHRQTGETKPEHTSPQFVVSLSPLVTKDEQFVWLQWFVATTLGWTVGFAVGEAVAGAVVETLPGVEAVAVVQAGAIIGSMVGAMVGTAQRFVLRRKFDGSVWWILVSVLGCTMGFAVARAVVGPVFEAMFPAVTGAMVGATTGAVLIWLFRHPIFFQRGP
jgi:hypothetical protein